MSPPTPSVAPANKNPAPLRIELWHGPQQHFGRLGVPQRWINLLGTVHGRADTLTCSINAGPAFPLSRGPDGLRLREAGDFNAEIPVDALRPGENHVGLEASDGDRAHTRVDVTIHWHAGNTWPLPYEVDWRRATHTPITDHVQLVEGRWHRDGAGIRPTVVAYDRLATLGDMAWTDYRIRVEATIHGFETNRKDPAHLCGGFGILVRWTGHHHDAHQPHREWRPNGAIAWYRANWERGSTLREFNISDAVVEDHALTHSEPVELPPDEPVLFDFAIRSRPGRSNTYHFVASPLGQPQHPYCDLETEGRDGEAPHGSILLIALHCDVTIGRIRVDPWPESPG